MKPDHNQYIDKKKERASSLDINNNDCNKKANDNLNTFITSRSCFRMLLLLLILLILSVVIHVTKTNTVNANVLQEGIASEIIRFHVIANSDSVKDQALKYVIKDALVKELSLYLKDSADINEARNVVIEQLSTVQKTAENIVAQNGYNYPVTISLEPWYFPIKVYGEYTFPAGTYEALRVQIGEAKGQNWWCVMFPPLCFVDETYSIVDKETEQQLKYLLTEKEYDTLKSERTPVKVKFKLWEEFKKLFD